MTETTPALTYTEVWTDDLYLRRLDHLARSIGHLLGAVVEVGVWEGRSLFTIADALPGKVIWAIDHWKGSDHDGTAAAAVDRDVCATFMANRDAYTSAHPNGPTIQPWRGDWREWFGDRTDGRTKLCLVHIDATHSYDEVTGNINAALPLVVPGGIVCGDDFQNPEVRRAVWNRLHGLRGGELFHAGALWWYQRQP